MAERAWLAGLDLAARRPDIARVITLAAALVVSAAPAAAATLWRITLVGSVGSGTGPSGEALADTPFTAILTFNAALGGRHTVDSGPLVLSDRIYGGATYADHPASPLVAGSFTILGATIMFGGATDTSITATYSDDRNHQVLAAFRGPEAIFTFDIFGPDIAPALDRTFEAFGPDGDGSFTAGNVNGRGFQFSSYRSDILRDAEPLPIPEPASWALMIAGFGAMGSALRRRRPPASTFSYRA
ncbi:PEPxxWA-CTERM sorting domain-containing protein [Sandaracinobacter sp.]|uniref:PEPxxWA-CTERM sorting domain-containing protein n=1 Tax=Sandaracinobacter sp. TaxID=2487581 RepID=UPI0035AF60A8